MASYDLTLRQKELLRTIVEQMKAGTGKEPLIPVVTHGGSFLIGIKGEFDQNLKGDLDILEELGLLKSRLNSKGEPIYSVRQSAYDAIENNFIFPDKERTINTGGGAYIGGNVSTSGGDFAGRDKIVRGNETSIAIGGSVSGSNIITGDGNIVNYSRPSDDLSRLIQQIQVSLDNSDLDVEVVEELKSDLARVQDQISKPEPNKEIILKRLKSSLDYVKLITSAAPLIELLKKSVVAANHLFGGNK